MNNCVVCGEPAEIIAVDQTVVDGEIETTEERYCKKHYYDMIDNEIEIPAERIETLMWRNE